MPLRAFSESALACRHCREVEPISSFLSTLVQVFSSHPRVPRSCCNHSFRCLVEHIALGADPFTNHESCGCRRASDTRQDRAARTTLQPAAGQVERSSIVAVDAHAAHTLTKPTRTPFCLFISARLPVKQTPAVPVFVSLTSRQQPRHPTWMPLRSSQQNSPTSHCLWRATTPTLYQRHRHTSVSLVARP